MNRTAIIATAISFAFIGSCFAQDADGGLAGQILAFKGCLARHGVTTTGARPGCRVTEEGKPQCLRAAEEIGSKCLAWVNDGGYTVQVRRPPVRERFAGPYRRRY